MNALRIRHRRGYVGHRVPGIPVNKVVPRQHTGKQVRIPGTHQCLAQINGFVEVIMPLSPLPGNVEVQSLFFKNIQRAPNVGFHALCRQQIGSRQHRQHNHPNDDWNQDQLAGSFQKFQWQDGSLR